MEDLGTITDTAAEVLTTVNQQRSTATRRINMEKSVWTADRIDRLKVLFADGLSCRMIAIQLGNDITRNAVIGKVSRMGLRPPEKREPSVSKRPRTSAGRHRRNRTTEPGIDVRARFDRASPFYGNEPQVRSFPEATDTREEFVPTNPIRFIDSTEQTCKWPLGEPTAEMLICGDPVRDQSGCPYCSYHARVAYSPSAPRKPWAPGRAE